MLTETLSSLKGMKKKEAKLFSYGTAIEIIITLRFSLISKVGALLYILFGKRMSVYVTEFCKL